MMSMSLRAGGLLMLVACGTAQPVTDCQVRPEYIAFLTRERSAGACSDLGPAMRLGAAIFESNDAHELWLKPSRGAELRSGVVLASFDPTNDCRFPQAGCATCVRTSDPEDNVCEERLEPIARVDPTDAMGARLIARGRYDARPDATGTCTADDSSIETNFEAVRLTQLDGGVVELPALPVALRFSEVTVVVGQGLQGGILRGRFERNEGPCAEQYSVFAVSPAIACLSDVDCAAVRAVAVLGDGTEVWGITGADGGLAVPDSGVTTYQVRGARYRAQRADGTLLAADGGVLGHVDASGRLLAPDGGLVPASSAPGAGLSSRLSPRCEVAAGWCTGTLPP